MRYSLLCSFLVILLFYSCSKEVNENKIRATAVKRPESSFSLEDLNGVWTFKKEPWEFTLKIKMDGNKLSALHTSLFNKGQKIDAAVEGDADETISGTFTGSRAQVNFVSGYSGAEGKAEINIKGSTLVWKITKSPDGEKDIITWEPRGKPLGFIPARALDKKKRQVYHLPGATNKVKQLAWHAATITSTRRKKVHFYLCYRGWRRKPQRVSLWVNQEKYPSESYTPGRSQVAMRYFMIVLSFVRSKYTMCVRSASSTRMS